MRYLHLIQRKFSAKISRPCRCLALLLLIACLIFSGCARQPAYPSEAFDQITAALEEFVYPGFEQVMPPDGYMLALPQEYKTVDDAVNILLMTQAYCYKSSKEPYLILMQVSAAGETEDNPNGWRGSMGFSTDRFNAPEGKYGSHILIESLPEVEVAVNCFTYGTCNFQLLCISSLVDGLTASEGLSVFCNALIPYLEEQDCG